MRRRWWLACVILVGVSSGCHSPRAPAPLPPIQQAPAEVAKLRVAVWNASDESARSAGETTVTGYTILVRKAVQRSFGRAGYTVVLQPTDPYDLRARVDVQNPSIERPGMASMTVTTPEGRVVEQVSELIALDERGDVREAGPVSLVEKLSGSRRLESFARGRERPACEVVAPADKPIPELAVPPADRAR